MKYAAAAHTLCMSQSHCSVALRSTKAIYSVISGECLQVATRGEDNDVDTILIGCSHALLMSRRMHPCNKSSWST